MMMMMTMTLLVLLLLMITTGLNIRVYKESSESCTPAYITIVGLIAHCLDCLPRHGVHRTVTDPSRLAVSSTVRNVPII
jgi:hypothetical protein